MDAEVRCSQRRIPLLDSLLGLRRRDDLQEQRQRLHVAPLPLELRDHVAPREEMMPTDEASLVLGGVQGVQVRQTPPVALRGPGSLGLTHVGVTGVAPVPVGVIGSIDAPASEPSHL